MSSRESFIEILNSRFCEDIREAYLECEHGPGKPIDYIKLGQILARLLETAKAAGLSAAEFQELMMASLPGLPVQVSKAA